MVSLIEMVDFFGFLFILIAAFLISSKHGIKAKVRIVVFSSYLVACFFLVTLGALSVPIHWWFIAQQIVLMLINVRGIYHAVSDYRDEIDTKWFGN